MKRQAEAALVAGLRRIDSGKFDLSDIRLLFIDLRQFIRHPLLKEVAHFVAHPEGRTQGIAHREIELNFRKVVRVANEAAPIALSPLDDTFMELWKYGIDQTRPDFARNYFGMDRQEASGWSRPRTSRQACRGHFERSSP